MRVDLLLVEKGMAPSRNRAQELIASGKVFLLVDGQKRVIRKSSVNVEPDAELYVEADANEFVSRGGIKLKGALERTHLDVSGVYALDVGISTGGFTDCLLQRGARFVVGVDVGHDQLAPKLRNDPRVKLFEGVNARDLSQTPIREAIQGRKFDLIVVDVSFISLTLVLPELIQYLDDRGHLLALVKPQFEVGREGLGKNGIVKNPELYRNVEEKIRKACAACALTVEDYFESPIEGSDGNREFFVLAKHAQLVLGALGDAFDSGKPHSDLGGMSESQEPQ